jgi:hypothetical protein
MGNVISWHPKTTKLIKKHNILRKELAESILKINPDTLILQILELSDSEGKTTMFRERKGQAYFTSISRVQERIKEDIENMKNRTSRTEK